jgi:uncharacterized NAD(P)/FAD-binding protein YdhS
MLPAVLKTGCGYKGLPAFNLKHFCPEALPEKPTLKNLIDALFKEISEAQGSPIDFETFKRDVAKMSSMEWLNHEIETAQKGVKNWQLVVFAFWPHMPSVWARLSLEDQKDFLANYYSLFMTFYGPFPVENAVRIREMLQSGQLEIMRDLHVEVAAPTQDSNRNAVQFVMHGKPVGRMNGPSVDFTCRRLFNCSGYGNLAEDMPLFRQMLQRGLAKQHPCGGLNMCCETLALVTDKASGGSGGMQGSQGREKIFVVGEPTRGKVLITTDMGRINNQAKTVADCMCEAIA